MTAQLYYYISCERLGVVEYNKQGEYGTGMRFRRDLPLNATNILMSVFSEEFAEQARAMSVGSFVVQLKGHENDYIKKLVGRASPHPRQSRGSYQKQHNMSMWRMM